MSLQLVIVDGQTAATPPPLSSPCLTRTLVARLAPLPVPKLRELFAKALETLEPAFRDPALVDEPFLTTCSVWGACLSKTHGLVPELLQLHSGVAVCAAALEESEVKDVSRLVAVASLLCSLDTLTGLSGGVVGAAMRALRAVAVQAGRREFSKAEKGAVAALIEDAERTLEKLCGEEKGKGERPTLPVGTLRLVAAELAGMAASIDMSHSVSWLRPFVVELGERALLVCQ